MSKIIQVYAGQTIRRYYRKNGSATELTACCDCGLVHLMEYAPRKNYIAIRAWRDEIQTRNMRYRKRKHAVKARLQSKTV